MSKQRANIYRAKQWFKVLQTTVMKLVPSQAAGDVPAFTFSVYSPPEYPAEEKS